MISRSLGEHLEIYNDYSTDYLVKCENGSGIWVHRSVESFRGVIYENDRNQ